MAKKDKTFSAPDVVRIWCHNLTVSEQRDVVVFFLLIYPATIMSDTEQTAITDLLGVVLPNRMARMLVGLLGRLLGVLRRVLLSSFVSLIYGTEMQTVVLDCIEKRLQN